MNKRDRIINAIRHVDNDITPYHVDFTVEELEKMAEYSGVPDFAGRIGNHIVGTSYAKWTEIAPTHAVPGDVPPENVMAMLDVFQNQDKYIR
ncbi:MAG: hypothetical protein FWE62_05180 [Firmicutes bacterium]|nr:hypothetical protein [Bacillota bacterium]